MSDSKLNMSLDDLIAKAKKQPGTSKSRGGGSAGKKGVRVGTRAPLKVVGSKAPPRGKTATGSKPATTGRQSVSVNLSSVRRGGVLKRGGPTRAAPFGQRTQAPYQGPRSTRAAAPPPAGGKWGHDMYAQTQQHVAPVVVHEVPRPAKTTSKLFISNLHYNVSEDDIRELFGVMGNLREYRVHYDSSGRSMGTAHVLFERPEEALAALRKYNNVALDGSKMRIELVEAPPPPPGTIQTLASGINVQVFEPTSSRGRGRGGYMRGGGRSSGRHPGGYGDGGDFMQE